MKMTFAASRGTLCLTDPVQASWQVATLPMSGPDRFEMTNQFATAPIHMRRPRDGFEDQTDLDDGYSFGDRHFDDGEDEGED